MNAADLILENRSLRGRLHLLVQASLHITGGLDFDTVLQEVLDSAGPWPGPTTACSPCWTMPAWRAKASCAFIEI